MAMNDELDRLLICEEVSDEDLAALYEILKIEAPTKLERRKVLNKEIRHNYGHTAANLLRGEYDPDYAVILNATAEKMKVTIKDHHTVAEVEDKLIVEAIDLMKANIIKEKGQKAWNDIEAEVVEQVDVMVREGNLEPSVAAQLKSLKGPALMAALYGGKLAGFALYAVANQAFFAVARFLGLRVSVAAAGPIIGKTLAFLLGPVGWAIAGAMLVYDLGNTSWKKTIPAVLAVAIYRRKYGLV